MSDYAYQTGQEAAERAQQYGTSAKEGLASTAGSLRERWPWGRILKWAAIVLGLGALAATVVVGGGIFLTVATVTAPVWLPLLLFVGLPLFVVFGIPTIALVTVVGGGFATVVVGALATFLVIAWLYQYLRNQHPPGSHMVDSMVMKSKQGLRKVRDSGKGMLGNWHE